MQENHMVVGEYIEDYCPEDKEPCPCIFCGVHCNETCEGEPQESHTSAALGLGLAGFMALAVVGILVIA